MSKTVVGIFKLESDAQNAQNYLLANGFGDGEVDIKTASYKSAPDDSTTADPEGDWIDRIGNFFKDLFNDDHEESQRFAHAGKHGTIVTVHATSTEEAMKAAAIMDEYGAEDVNASYPDYASGQQYEDPILNPPAVSEQHGLGNQTFQDTPRTEAGNVRSKSRIIERHVEHSNRLRQQENSTGTMHVSYAGTDRGQNTPADDSFTEKSMHTTGLDSEDSLDQQEILNKTVQERDELLNEIVTNKVQDQPLQNRGV